MSSLLVNLLVGVGSLAYAALVLAVAWGTAAWIAGTGSSPAWLLGVFLGLPALLFVALAATQGYWEPRLRRLEEAKPC